MLGSHLLDIKKDISDRRAEVRRTLKAEVNFLSGLAESLDLLGESVLAKNVRASAESILNAERESSTIAIADAKNRTSSSNRLGFGSLTALLHRQ